MTRLKNAVSNLIVFFKLIHSFFRHPADCRVKYSIAKIEQDQEGDYHVSVKALMPDEADFRSKPEEILADDELTKGFSPLDTRALTYLGYLDVNTPKYEILANRLSCQTGNMVFAFKEKGKAEPILKTAEEISGDDKFIGKLNQKDAHRIGYTTAAQAEANEQRIKAQLLQAKQGSQQDV